MAHKKYYNKMSGEKLITDYKIGKSYISPEDILVNIMGFNHKEQTIRVCLNDAAESVNMNFNHFLKMMGDNKVYVIENFREGQTYFTADNSKVEVRHIHGEAKKIQFLFNDMVNDMLNYDEFLEMMNAKKEYNPLEVFEKPIGFKAIIQSLLDQDLYKITMMQAIFLKFPDVMTTFRFKCRNHGIKFTQAQTKRIREQVKHLCSLRFQKDELQYLSALRFMKKAFVDYLKFFQLQYEDISIENVDGELQIETNGSWLTTTLFEVFVLAIVNEVYFQDLHVTENYAIGESRLKEKIEQVKALNHPAFKFSDFGTRRRYSREWQYFVVKELAKELPENFIGTSNIYLAMTLGLMPIGTMAHEWLQAGQALTRVKDSQKFMFQTWADVYRGDLGIALSDVVGVNAFINDFDAYFCKLFDGCRHDSGNPIEWGKKIIAMYKKFFIDPITKRAVFSDGLTMVKAFEIFHTFVGQILMSFGIGTFLTNDMGLDALNIVMKMVRCNGLPVAKIPDSKGKGMCDDDEYVTYLKHQFGITD